MQDRLFLLSLDEYNKYVAGNRKYMKIRVPLVHKQGILGRIASRLRSLSTGEYEFLYNEWMLRTKGSELDSYCTVDAHGKIGEHCTENCSLIRPAMKININSTMSYVRLDDSVRRNFHNGSVISLGEIYGKRIKWYVLDEKEGLVLSKYPLFYCEESQVPIQVTDDHLSPPGPGKEPFVPFDVNDITIPETDDSYQYSLVRFFLQLFFMVAIEPKEKILIEDVKLYENENIRIMAK